MRATTLVKFDATHQMKYNPPLNCRKQFHSSQGEFHRKKVFVIFDKDLFSGGAGVLKDEHPSKAPVSLSNAVSISFRLEFFLSSRARRIRTRYGNRFCVRNQLVVTLDKLT
jgi:hypothetical protein